MATINQIKKILIPAWTKKINKERVKKGLNPLRESDWSKTFKYSSKSLLVSKLNIVTKEGFL